MRNTIRVRIPVRPTPPSVARNHSGSILRSDGVDDAIGCHHVHFDDVLSEASRVFVVLAVNVVGDGATDGRKRRAGTDRNKPAARQKNAQQSLESDAGLDGDFPGLFIERKKSREPGRRHQNPAGIDGAIAI